MITCSTCRYANADASSCLHASNATVHRAPYISGLGKEGGMLYSVWHENMRTAPDSKCEKWRKKT